MTQPRAFRPPPGMPVSPAWPQPARTPSGLFPAGPPAPPAPSRPTYREPHPVRRAALGSGAGAAAAWALFFGLLGRDLASYAWWTLIASGLAWLTALGLTRFGDRGVAAGIAIVTSAAVSIVAVLVGIRWAGTGDWPLW